MVVLQLSSQSLDDKKAFLSLTYIGKEASALFLFTAKSTAQ